ncbi:MAG: hypothetical protein RI580_18645, partial [Halothece sp. Uz-M2-17]|nr:hypothetical protein [Halothece sp. Uz-M2-17]
MLGQNYFEKRLGDIYQYSPIPYKCGKGRTISQQYDWELCIDACGNIIFILSSDCPLQTFCYTSKIEHFSGISDDGIWSINCTKINILERKEIIISRTRTATLFCLPESITLKHKYYSTNSPNLAKAYFSNFSFSRVDLEAGFSTKISS